MSKRTYRTFNVYKWNGTAWEPVEQIDGFSVNDVIDDIRTFGGVDDKDKLLIVAAEDVEYREVVEEKRRWFPIWRPKVFKGMSPA